jgi:hypothetical protein
MLICIDCVLGVSSLGGENTPSHKNHEFHPFSRAVEIENEKVNASLKKIEIIE